MIRNKTYKPVSVQLIDAVAKGFKLMDKSAQAEIAAFIAGKQHESGLFTGRDNTPDLYYTLFGAWMSEAVGSGPSLEKLKSYFSQKECGSVNDNDIDFYATIMIRHLLFGKSYQKPGFYFFIRSLSGKKTDISLPYRIFLFLLAYDTFYKRRMFFRLMARLPLYTYNLPADSPNSFHAAMITAKLSAGMKVEKEKEALLACFKKDKGFRIFSHMDNADLLSTAVSLFALNKASVDLRLMAPDCLRLIEDNYRDGAFISGDGDETKDLEYTFYGLLALGSLTGD